MEIELTAEQFIEEWRNLLLEDEFEIENYEEFETCIMHMEEIGVKFYLSEDGVPIIDTTDYMNQVDDLESQFKL